MMILTVGILSIVFATMAYMAIWSRRPTNARFYTLILFPVFLGVSALSVCANLGYPTLCIRGVTIPDGKLKVLGGKVVKNDKIYLLLDTPGSPTFCSVPYSHEAAKSFQEGQAGNGNEAEGDSMGKALADAFGLEVEGSRSKNIYPTPQKRNPPKMGEEVQTFGE